MKLRNVLKEEKSYKDREIESFLRLNKLLNKMVKEYKSAINHPNNTENARKLHDFDFIKMNTSSIANQLIAELKKDLPWIDKNA